MKEAQHLVGGELSIDKDHCNCIVQHRRRIIAVHGVKRVGRMRKRAMKMPAAEAAGICIQRATSGRC